MRRTLVVAVTLAGMALPAQAHASLQTLIASCSGPLHPSDDSALAYRKCDDGVPSQGGRTPNPGADKAVEVPAAYRYPPGATPAGVTDPTVDGLPPADPVASCGVPGSAPSTTTPGTCSVALDADLYLPPGPPPVGGYPLIAMMHGCCSNNKTSWESGAVGPAGEKWHYNPVWFATRGYAVLTYTSRGFVTGQGHGSTGESQLDSLQYEMNDFQSLAGQLADDAYVHADPQKVVATGGSYGGGFSWLALVDPLWKSPGGKDMRLAAVAPKYGWTDVIDSLLPTGRQFFMGGPLPATDGSDSGNTPPGAPHRQLVGIPKRAILAGLYAAGKTGVPPGTDHATFPSSVDEAIQCTQTSYPAESNPLCADAIANVLPDFIRYRSAYYWNSFFAHIASDPAYRVPVFSAGTFTDPLFPPIEHRRMVERLKATAHGYPVQEYYGDYQHFVQNKDKEWNDVCGADRHVCRVGDYPNGDLSAPPNGLRRTGATTLLNRFLDYFAIQFFAKPPIASAAAPPFDVTASLQVCENKPDGQIADEPGPTFTAPSFAALAPRTLELRFAGDQQTVNDAAPNTHAKEADPVFNTATNANKCVIHHANDPAGPGVAVYESGALPRDATMIGAGTVDADYSASGSEGLELNARLYDVFPDGDAVMVDRAPRRIDPGRDGATHVRYQLHGNGWRFRAGHKLRLELAQDDDPYLHVSNVPSSMTLRAVTLRLPVRESGFGAPDRIAPTAKVLAPRLASDVSRTARFGVRWRGADIGSGLAYFRVQYTRLTARSGRAHATALYHTLRRATGRTALSFKGRLGGTYLFRARAVDRAGNAGPWAYAETIVPTAEHPRGSRYRGRWRLRHSRGAFGGRLIVCSSSRCRLTWSYRGAGVFVVARTGPRGGYARISLDGHGRRVSLYSRRVAQRRVVFRASRRDSRHVLRVDVLARRPRHSRGREVALDGFAVRLLA